MQNRHQWEDLTLTSVVFESAYGVLGDKVNGYLTLTSVVFE